MSKSTQLNSCFIQTTPQYWDCECETNYIKPASDPHCEHCGYDRDTCPDSRVTEVAEFTNN